MVVICKFSFIFGFNVKKLSELSYPGCKELEIVPDFLTERILADTNRRPFTRFFMKTMDPVLAVASLNSANTGYITLII